MERAQALETIKKSIAQGNLEEAYDQLVGFLGSSEDYAELADIARVNQADLYQIKAQTLKGTIDSEEARLAMNQLADKALRIVRQVETGKVLFEEEIKPTSSKALRYYIIGGLVTLAAAILVWQFWDYKKQQDTCPVFSETAELKVMILPFKQTGPKTGIDPAVDIMDDLNDLIEKTPGLRVRALADVHEQYPIDEDYPNSAQAVDIARNCSVQMLVWGKVSQFGDKAGDYTLDVRYRLLDAGGVRFAGDTTLSRLLAVTEEANWISDTRAISRLLYMVLANQLQIPIASSILNELNPIARLDADSLPPIDTSTSFVLADQYLVKNQKDSAIAEYNKVLAYYPDNATALKKRGALYFQKEEYAAAARDLEAVTVCDKQSAKALQETRVKALLQSEQPEKAKKVLEEARKDKLLDGTWIDKKTREVQDSTAALKSRLDVMERVASRTKDPNTQIKTAKANLGVGDPDDALKYATKALKMDPKNLEAVQIAVDAQLQKGDTAKAARTIKEAERAGADVKSIFFQPVRKLPLEPKKQ